MSLSCTDTLPAVLGAQVKTKLNDKQKVDKDKDNAKTKEKNEEKNQGETAPLPSTTSSNPQVEFSSQSGPNSPR